MLLLPDRDTLAVVTGNTSETDNLEYRIIGSTPGTAGANLRQGSSAGVAVLEPVGAKPMAASTIDPAFPYSLYVQPFSTLAQQY